MIKNMSKVLYRLENVSIFNQEDWPSIMKFLMDNMIKLEKAFKKYIDKYSKENNVTKRGE